MTFLRWLFHSVAVGWGLGREVGERDLGKRIWYLSVVCV